MNHVTDNAQSAREASLHSGKMSDQGAEVIHDAVIEMGKIEVSVKGFSNIIQSLEQQSNEISAIVNVIGSSDFPMGHMSRI
jgi:methyl-accepting chemotaxis protein